MAKRIIIDENLEKDLEHHRQLVYVETSETIRTAVEESGLSQRAIAKKMNTSSHTPLLKALSNTNMQLSTLSDIAVALGKRVKIILE